LRAPSWPATNHDGRGRRAGASRRRGRGRAGPRAGGRAARRRSSPGD